LYRLVFEQSAVTAIMGFVVGIGLTLLAEPFATDIVPQFVLLHAGRTYFWLRGRRL
jgi:hypothetical protein